MAERIERIGRRYGDPSGCVVCHGGNPATTDREVAHLGAPAQLSASGGPSAFYPDPGDARVVDRACGQCHEGYMVRHGASAPSASPSSCSSCHIPDAADRGSVKGLGQSTPGTTTRHLVQGGGVAIEKAGQGTRSARSAVAMTSCFRCHFDPRTTSVNGTGDALVHYGDAHEGPRLICADCHTSGEMHGDPDGTAEHSSVDRIACEDCHGTLERLPWELPLASANGSGPPRGTVRVSEESSKAGPNAQRDLLLTSSGAPFGNVVREGERALLYAASGAVIPITLLKDFAIRGSWRSELGRQVKSAPGIHSAMTCIECHADWLPPCLGCHDR